MLERKLISTEKYRSYRLLFERFQRVRKHAIGEALQGKLNSISDQQWCDWLLRPIKESLSNICIESVKKNSINRLKNQDQAKAAACFTCGECSSACPIACERGVFDPRTLFRMFNIGLVDELLSDPAIWLCLECGRCTDACSQLIDGRKIVRQLKDLAVKNRIVDQNFFMRLEQVNRLVHARWLEEVDALFSVKNKLTSSDSHVFNEFSICCRERVIVACA
jgi:heterodisulfide reductase subunit C